MFAERKEWTHKIYFDTGASRNMAGIKNRMKEICPMINNYDINITGVNGNTCMVNLVGLNELDNT